MQLTTNAPQPLLPKASVLFVSKAGVATGAVESYNLKKRIEVVKNCRSVQKHHMKFNGAMPEMKVDAESFVSCYRPIRTASFPVIRTIPTLALTKPSQTVTADGVECRGETAKSLPLTHSYYLY